MRRSQRKKLGELMECPSAIRGVDHAWWKTMRFPWPIGVVFPDRLTCLYCGAVK